MEKQFNKGMVSVIMPVYNAKKYINTSLASVFAQTYENLEIVLVDDCSTDGSGDIIAKLSKDHPEIVYSVQEENMGAGHARNKALSLARGQYVAFLDSDDEWMPDKIRRQVNLMREKKAPLSYTAIEMIDKDGHIVKRKRSIKETCDYTYLLHNTIIATSSVVVDRMAVGNFEMHLRRGGQDYATWLKLLRDGIVAYGINESLVRYRVMEGSLSSNKFNSIRQVWEIQTQNEKICLPVAAIHTICFAFNALKKYLF
jgi:teichuronic acid biosynthesis glycosyltransferase TuaG